MEPEKVQKPCAPVITNTNQKLLTRLLTMSEICDEVLKCHRATGWRMLKVGALPPPTIKVGRIVKWSADALEAWIAKGVTA